MRRRIYRVLIITSAYDAFLLEEDGRIDEQIFNEYTSLSLRYPPNFIIATSKEAFQKYLKEESIDLVIEMLSAADETTYQWANEIKHDHPDIPIVVLTPFIRELSLKIEKKELKNIDFLFAWLGDADILLAIIKLIEDQMNADNDILGTGVQCIILVEDSVRFYSSYLPAIYKIIFQQSKAFMSEGLNEHQKMLRMRGRPKILLAKTYEEAKGLYLKYKKNVLGIISDISYCNMGKMDHSAGLKLCKLVKEEDKYMSVLLQSSDSRNEALANALGAGFINKNSKTLICELSHYIKEYFAFGDFVFINPKTKKEVARAKNLRDLQQKIHEVPNDSFRYHVKRNHLSKWLQARALFSLSDLFRQFTPEDFEDINEVKEFVYKAISKFRKNKSQGVIAEFDPNNFDESLTFSRIGQASLGGKARGLAFIDTLIKRNHLADKYEDTLIAIPRTVVLCTDIFDDFMTENDLYQTGHSDSLRDEEILQKFIDAKLPAYVTKNLRALISNVKKPLAIRSSSLLEDSCYQPFAGIYSTYMIPFYNDIELFLETLQKAIKCVYASVFYKESKAYMNITKNLLEEEKMAIVIQEVCGKQYDKHFYPLISGVARSANYYPLYPEKTEDGVANIALGLGKYIVDGGHSIRFSPKYPKKVLQFSRAQFAIEESQKIFFAIDMSQKQFVPSTDDAKNLLQLDLADANKDGSLKFVCSTYSFDNDCLYDGYQEKGMKLITFSHILKYDTFKLSKILQDLLEVGKKEMMKQVEIEFAIELDVPKGEDKIFNILQIRPISSSYQEQEIELKDTEQKDMILWSEKALGNGFIDGICDVIYLKPENFDPSKTPEIAETIGQLNEKLEKEGRNYILIGPGRWGSIEPWLGVPIKWNQISAVRLLVESGLKNFSVDPSQGTHFFQNLTAFGVGYLSLNPTLGDGYYDTAYLNKQKSLFEDNFVRHVRFEKPMGIFIDGKTSRGAVMKPEKTQTVSLRKSKSNITLPQKD
jgi:Pyruvate phosphate dikinase, PEP/pyruvate binding domain.